MSDDYVAGLVMPFFPCIHVYHVVREKRLVFVHEDGCVLGVDILVPPRP